jgi:hypothetical protein
VGGMEPGLGGSAVLACQFGRLGFRSGRQEFPSDRQARRMHRSQEGLAGSILLLAVRFFTLYMYTIEIYVPCFSAMSVVVVGIGAVRRG